MPGLIRLAQSNSIGVPGTAVPAKSFVRAFGNVRAAHHYRNTGFAKGISYAIGPRDHARHCPDTDKSDILVFTKPHKLFAGHRFSVSVDQDHFVFLWRQGLKQEHPQMRHKIARYAIIRVIQ